MNDYKELLGTARVMIDDILGIKEGEKVLILSDTGVEGTNGLPELRKALFTELADRGINPGVFYFQAQSRSDGRIPELGELACQNADVVIPITKWAFLRSLSFGRIMFPKEGKAPRTCFVPTGFTTAQGDYVYRTLPKSSEEYYELLNFENKLITKFINGVHRVHVLSDKGTDMTFTVGKMRGPSSLGLLQKADKPGMGAMLPLGGIVMGIDEGSAEGTLVIDSCNALRNGFLEDSIIYEVKNGSAVSITGGKEAENFIAASNNYEGTPEQKYMMAEFGIGCNKNCLLNGRAGEGENVYGSAHVGIGSNGPFGGTVSIPDWHVDSIMSIATVYVDGELILDNGEYVI